MAGYKVVDQYTYLGTPVTFIDRIQDLIEKEFEAMGNQRANWGGSIIKGDFKLESQIFHSYIVSKLKHRVIPYISGFALDTRYQNTQQWEDNRDYIDKLLDQYETAITRDQRSVKNRDILLVLDVESMERGKNPLYLDDFHIHKEVKGNPHLAYVLQQRLYRRLGYLDQRSAIGHEEYYCDHFFVDIYKSLPPVLFALLMVGKYYTPPLYGTREKYKMDAKYIEPGEITPGNPLFNEIILEKTEVPQSVRNLIELDRKDELLLHYKLRRDDYDEKTPTEQEDLKSEAKRLYVEYRTYENKLLKFLREYVKEIKNPSNTRTAGSD